MNFKNFSVQELSANEQKSINGGYEAYPGGCNYSGGGMQYEGGFIGPVEDPYGGYGGDGFRDAFNFFGS